MISMHMLMRQKIVNKDSALCMGGIKLTCTKKMHGHLPNQCTLLKGMYVILNGCCTYPLHLILRQQPEKL